MSDAEPSRSLEVERKYDVADRIALPDWTALPGVATVDAPEVRELDARYFDTDDLALGRARIALRRRTGGPDEGWHVKSASEEGRHEAHWPLGIEDAADAVPAAVAASAGVAAPLRPLARLRNTRVAYTLRDAAGGVVAEVVDDRVRALAERTGATRAWREWEVELGSAAPVDQAAFFAAVDALVRSAGGAPASAESKLGRALGA